MINRRNTVQKELVQNAVYEMKKHVIYSMIWHRKDLLMLIFLEKSESVSAKHIANR